MQRGIYNKMGLMKYEINFSENWNDKLNNKLFTTIRRYTRFRIKKLSDAKGEIVDILLDGKKYKEAILVGFDVLPFSEVPLGLLRLDIGSYDRKDIEILFGGIGIYSDTDVIVFYLRSCDN